MGIYINMIYHNSKSPDTRKTINSSLTILFVNEWEHEYKSV